MSPNGEVPPLRFFREAYQSLPLKEQEGIYKTVLSKTWRWADGKGLLSSGAIRHAEIVDAVHDAYEYQVTRGNPIEFHSNGTLVGIWVWKAIKEVWTILRRKRKLFPLPDELASDHEKIDLESGNSEEIAPDVGADLGGSTPASRSNSPSVQESRPSYSQEMLTWTSRWKWFVTLCLSGVSKNKRTITAEILDAIINEAASQTLSPTLYSIADDSGQFHPVTATWMERWNLTIDECYKISAVIRRAMRRAGISAFTGLLHVVPSEERPRTGQKRLQRQKSQLKRSSPAQRGIGG